MLHLKYTIRLLCVTLLALALVAPALHKSADADAGRLSPTAADDDDDEGDDDDRGQRDPCRKALKRAAKGKPLPPGCASGGGGGGVAKGDFNGDGIGDLAVGVPFEDVGTVEDAGAVNVIYGSSDGLVATGNQFLNQSTSGVNGTAGTGDHFGWAVASGHFNGDDYSDLAVGVPNEDLGGLSNVGAVQVFYGSAAGLTTAGQQFWDFQDLPSNPGLPRMVPASYDQWGYSLVWADFNGDGAGDLVIGVPNASTRHQSSSFFVGEHTVDDTGAVVALLGGVSGLSVLGMQTIVQDSRLAPIDRGSDLRDQGFGLTLTAGDYDGDGFADLAVGVPYRDFFEGQFLDIITQATGEVYVIYGYALGLNAERFVLLDQGFRDGTPEANDQFGSALATGDFNEDGRADLAVGVPFEDSFSGSATGLVQVFFGASVGFGLEDSFDQTNLLFDGRETGDRFGWALATGDFDGDGADDLAIGVPGEDIGTIANAGIVQIVHGPGGPVPQVWHQNVTGVLNTAEEGDQFGFSLSAWNFGRTTHADLAIGVPFEDVFDAQLNTIVDAGGVQLIYGSANGLATTGNQLWTQNNLSGSLSEAGDQFGRVVY